MPELRRITSTFFFNMLERLGVKPPPSDGFTLINTVQPVSLVDVDVPIISQLTPPLLGTVSSAGPLGLPVAGTVLADNGAIPATGNYLFTLMFGASLEGSGTTHLIQRRNAANNANIWEQSVNVGLVHGGTMLMLYITLLVNERLRIVMGPQNGSAASIHQASIWRS